MDPIRRPWEQLPVGVACNYLRYDPVHGNLEPLQAEHLSTDYDIRRSLTDRTDRHIHQDHRLPNSHRNVFQSDNQLKQIQNVTKGASLLQAIIN